MGEVALLREIHFAVFGEPDPVGVDLVAISEEAPPSGHRFFPVPGCGVGHGCGGNSAAAILVGTEDLWDLWDLSSSLSGLDEDVVSVARAWRIAADGPPGDGVRVALVEVAEWAAAYDITLKAQRMLAAAGVVDPQVEVYWTGMDLPPYHEEALAGSALLWRPL